MKHARIGRANERTCERIYLLTPRIGHTDAGSAKWTTAIVSGRTDNENIITVEQLHARSRRTGEAIRVTCSLKDSRVPIGFEMIRNALRTHQFIRQRLIILAHLHLYRITILPENFYTGID